MNIQPVDGWSTFKQFDEVVELVAQSLPLLDNQGIWEYYNFNSRSSVWCSDEVEAMNQLQLEFASSDDDAPIQRLSLEMTNNASPYFKQLFRLKKELRKRFEIYEI